LNPDKTREIEAATCGSSFMHLWTSVLRTSNVLTAVRPPTGSFLDEVYRRLAVVFETDLEYDWSDVASVILLQEQHQALRREYQASYDEVVRLQALVDVLESENEELRMRRHSAARHAIFRALRMIAMPVNGIGTRLGWRWLERVKHHIYYALFPELK
jgi:cell division protein FtsB